MSPSTKASRAAEAIKKLDDSAVEAQKRINVAAEKAQAMIDAACKTATDTLELASRVPDKRNLNGSFQWDRGDRYRRGSDDRMDRLEEKLDELDKANGEIQVGQATRAEQINRLLSDVKCIIQDVAALKTSINMRHDALSDHVDELEKRAYFTDKLAKAAVMIVSAIIVAFIWVVMAHLPL